MIGARADSSRVAEKGEGDMVQVEYDLITVGGGLAGSALAKTMAEAGARVLVLERETQFKDRVRGEGMTPWGVVEARALGIACGAAGHMRARPVHVERACRGPRRVRAATWRQPPLPAPPR